MDPPPKARMALNGTRYHSKTVPQIVSCPLTVHSLYSGMTFAKATNPLISKNQMPARVIAVLFLCLFAAQGFRSAWTVGQTSDETYYNGSAYAMVRYQNFEVQGEHPPFITELGALPLLFLKPNFSPSDFVYLPGSSENFDVSRTGANFLYHKGNDPRLILFLERSVVVLLTLVLGAALFEWALALYGAAGALIALGLFTFSPDMAAHGSLFTTDMGVTVFFFLAVFAFSRYFETRSFRSAIAAGALSGMALISKISAVTLLPILLVLFIFTIFCEKNQAPPSRRLPLPVLILAVLVFVFSLGEKLTLIGIAPVCLVLFSLHFEEVWGAKPKERLISHLALIGGWAACFISAFLSAKKGALFFTLSLLWVAPACFFSFYLTRSKAGPVLRHAVKAFSLICLVAALVIALGYTDFFKSLFSLSVYGHFKQTFMAAFSHSSAHHAVCAENSFVTCDWRYFAAALSLKLPAGTLILFFAGLVTLFFVPLSHRARALILVPLTIYFLIASLLNKINIGVRHVLPLYPFIFLTAGAVGLWIQTRPGAFFRKSAFAAVILLMAQMALRHFSFAPDFVSYYNEFVASPEKAAALLADSNLNWGQHNRSLAEYVRKHSIPHIKIISGTANADEYDYYKIPWSQGEDADLQNPSPGYYALSIAVYLTQQASPGSAFKDRKPDDIVGRGFYIFKINQKVVNGEDVYEKQ